VTSDDVKSNKVMKWQVMKCWSDKVMKWQSDEVASDEVSSDEVSSDEVLKIYKTKNKIAAW